MKPSKLDILSYLNMSEDARLSYGRLKELYDGVIWIEDKGTNTQGFALLDSDCNELVFAFRGSQQLQDWFNDFNAFHMVCPYGNTDSKIKIHRGFLECYKSVREQIHDIIKRHLRFYYIKAILGTGHSLGGSLATLFCVDAQYNFESEILENSKDCEEWRGVIGFTSGAPKVGNKQFCASFNKRIPNFTRTYHRRDWVPMCPPTAFGGVIHGGYHHVGNSNPLGTFNPFQGLQHWITSLRNPKDLISDLASHSIDLYRECI